MKVDPQPEGGEALLLADRALTPTDMHAVSDGGCDEAFAPWYAIWTRSHCERLVAQQLSAKGFSPFLPEMSVRSRRFAKPQAVQTPMFPGYLFLRHAMEKHSYIEILKARGVVRILEGGWNRLTPIADEEIHAIERLVESGAPVLPHPYFHQGDRVRVVEGPLTGVEGVFLRDKPNRGRLVVSVNLLQTSVAVEVDCDDVSALPPARKM